MKNYAAESALFQDIGNTRHNSCKFCIFEMQNLSLEDILVSILPIQAVLLKFRNMSMSIEKFSFVTSYLNQNNCWQNNAIPVGSIGTNAL